MFSAVVFMGGGRVVRHPGESVATALGRSSSAVLGLVGSTSPKSKSAIRKMIAPRGGATLGSRWRTACCADLAALGILWSGTEE